MSLLKKIKTFFIPAEVQLRQRRLELLIWSFLLALSYYPDYFGFLAWVSLVRPIMIISSLNGRAAFNAAYFFAFFFNLFSIYWVGMVTIPGMIAAILLVAFYYTFVFMLYKKVYNLNPLYGMISLPFLWVGMEYFRTLSEFAFPWSDLGYSQSYYLTLMQIVSVTSIHGLSFLIVVVNILLWQILRKTVAIERKVTAFLFSVGIIFVLWGFGWVEMPKYPEPGTTKVALLQGSVPIEVKWKEGNTHHSFMLYDSLANSINDTTVKLYVWPETSAPRTLSTNAPYRRFVGRIAAKTNAYHLVGALGETVADGKEKPYNSAYYFQPDGQLVLRYDKMKLVPFSEHVPYQDYLPFLQKGFLQDYLSFIKTYNVQFWSDFYPGDSLKLFPTPDYSFATLICFESTFPEFVRNTIQEGADFLVGITNDTWFGESVGIHMHSRIFITRCIENRSWGVRVANSGLTYTVDQFGRIRSSLELNEVAALKAEVDLLDGFSMFTRLGDVIGLTSFLLTLSLGVIFIILWIYQKLFIRRP